MQRNNESTNQNNMNNGENERVKQKKKRFDFKDFKPTVLTDPSSAFSMMGNNNNSNGNTNEISHQMGGRPPSFAEAAGPFSGRSGNNDMNNERNLHSFRPQFPNIANESQKMNDFSPKTQHGFAGGFVNQRIETQSFIPRKFGSPDIRNNNSEFMQNNPTQKFNVHEFSPETQGGTANMHNTMNGYNNQGQMNYQNQQRSPKNINTQSNKISSKNTGNRFGSPQLPTYTNTSFGSTIPTKAINPLTVNRQMPPAPQNFRQQIDTRNLNSVFENVPEMKRNLQGRGHPMNGTGNINNNVSGNIVDNSMKQFGMDQRMNDQGINSFPRMSHLPVNSFQNTQLDFFNSKSTEKSPSRNEFSNSIGDKNYETKKSKASNDNMNNIEVNRKKPVNPILANTQTQPRMNPLLQKRTQQNIEYKNVGVMSPGNMNLPNSFHPANRQNHLQSMNAPSPVKKKRGRKPKAESKPKSLDSSGLPKVGRPSKKKKNTEPADSLQSISSEKQEHKKIKPRRERNKNYSYFYSKTDLMKSEGCRGYELENDPVNLFFNIETDIENINTNGDNILKTMHSDWEMRKALSKITKLLIYMKESEQAKRKELDIDVKDVVLSSEMVERGLSIMFGRNKSVYNPDSGL